MDGQGTKWRRKIAEIYNRGVRERYRQTTDDRHTREGRATAYSERERSLKTTSVCDGDARSVGGGRGWWY